MLNASELVGAVVLCGGQSRRMREPKAWLKFGTEFLLQRVIRRLRPAVGPVVVVAAPHQVLPPLPQDVRIANDPAEYRGPLQGVAVGLAAIPDDCEWAYVTGCDTPFVSPDWLKFLRVNAEWESICLADVEGYLQPLAALYRTTVADQAVQLLDSGKARLIDLLEVVPARIIPDAEVRRFDPTLRMLRNLNTPTDYQAALAELTDT